MHCFVFQIDANNLADHIVSLITCVNLVTPMKEINKGELPDTPDLPIPQLVREPLIRLVDKNWVDSWPNVLAMKPLYVKESIKSRESQEMQRIWCYSL